MPLFVKRTASAGLVLIAAAIALIPLPAQQVERYYSTSVYRTVQPLLSAQSNGVPFPLFDALILLTLIYWMVALILDFLRIAVEDVRLRVAVPSRVALDVVDGTEEPVRAALGDGVHLQAARTAVFSLIR